MIYKPFALIIGRFQPPCNHHVSMLTEVVQKSHCQKLFLGIGVANKIDERNFLNFEEVKKLMVPILNKLNVEYEIQPIPDINNSPKYCEHVESIFPKIDENNTILYTENSYTSDCFVNYGHNYQVIKPTILPIRATMIREMILKGKSWQNLVPPHVADFLNLSKSPFLTFSSS